MGQANGRDMTAKRYVSTEQKNLQSLVEQLAYLIDELAAQVSLFERMPESIMLSAPIPGTLSIRDRYLVFLVREEHLNRRVISGIIDGSLVGQEIEHVSEPSKQENMNSWSILQIVERISATRTVVIAWLRGADADKWSREIVHDGQKMDLRRWAYRMAMQDADDLREIGIQFSEQRLTFREED